MNFNRVTFLLSLILLGFTEAYGQKGYVMIDSAYSTGFIERQGKKLTSRELKFRKSASSPITTYYPSTISEFGFNDQLYRSRKISTGTDSTAYFLHVLSKGDITLYTVKVNGKKRFFAERENEFVELIKENDSYRNQISRLFENCSAHKEHLNDLKFSKGNLRRFFILQNTCYQKGPWPTNRWTGIAGLSFINLSVFNIYGEKLSFKGNTPFFGVGLELPMGANPSWSFLLQALFQQNKFEKSRTQLFAFEIRESKQEMKISTLSVPALFKYSLPMQSVKAYISAGPSLAYTLENTSYLEEKIQRQNETIENEDSSELMRKLTFSGNLWLGVEYYLTQKISIGLEARYSNGRGLGTDPHSLSAKQLAVILNF